MVNSCLFMKFGINSLDGFWENAFYGQMTMDGRYGQMTMDGRTTDTHAMVDGISSADIVKQS